MFCTGFIVVAGKGVSPGRMNSGSAVLHCTANHTEEHDPDVVQAAVRLPAPVLYNASRSGQQRKLLHTSECTAFFLAPFHAPSSSLFFWFLIPYQNIYTSGTAIFPVPLH
jgi:hypothetical protein